MNTRQQTAVYGAGRFGQAFCEELEKTGVAIDFFIDEYTDKKELLGKPIYRLKDIENPSNVTVHVSTLNTKIVLENLSKMGFNFLPFLQTFSLASSLPLRILELKKLWFSNNINEMCNNEKIDKFYTLLADDKSRDLLNKIKKFRTYPLPESYISPTNELKEQYFPKDIEIFKNLPSIRFIDCGAFTGDTAAAAVQYFDGINKPIEYIACFEPDAENFKQLNAEVYLWKSRGINSSFIVYPIGVWSKNEILHFNSNFKVQSSLQNSKINNPELNSQHLVSVFCATLDSTVYGIEPNYIKMDLEGAEYEALLGTQQIIKQFSPVLAISLYHKPSDLYEIPLLIHSINPNYNYYIRIYEEFCIDTVLYCVPKN